MAASLYDVYIYPYPLVNLSVVSSTSQTYIITDSGSYYSVEVNETDEITVSADGYQSQTETILAQTTITLLPDILEMSKLSNGTDVYNIRDDVARESISNLATVATSGSYNDLTNKLTAFTGADGTNAGTSGIVPAPTATDNTKFLKGDGTWAVPSIANMQTTTNLVTSVSSSSTDSQYPSAKLFYDTVGDIESALHTINSGGSDVNLSWYGNGDPYVYGIYINSELVLSESDGTLPATETLIGTYNTGSEVNISLTYEAPFPKGVTGYKLYVNEVNVATATSSSSTVNYTFTLSEDTVMKLEQV